MSLQVSRQHVLFGEAHLTHRTREGLVKGPSRRNLMQLKVLVEAFFGRKNRIKAELTLVECVLLLHVTVKGRHKDRIEGTQFAAVFFGILSWRFRVLRFLVFLELFPRYSVVSALLTLQAGLLEFRPLNSPLQPVPLEVLEKLFLVECRKLTQITVVLFAALFLAVRQIF